MQQFHRLAHLGANGMVDAAKAGEGQHGNSRGSGRSGAPLGSAECDFNQVFGSGIDVHAGVGQEEEFSIARDHGVAPGDAVLTFAHANDLQWRAEWCRENAG